MRTSERAAAEEGLASVLPQRNDGVEAVSDLGDYYELVAAAGDGSKPSLIDLQMNAADTLDLVSQALSLEEHRGHVLGLGTLGIETNAELPIIEEQLRNCAVSHCSSHPTVAVDSSMVLNDSGVKDYVCALLMFDPAADAR